MLHILLTIGWCEVHRTSPLLPEFNVVSMVDLPCIFFVRKRLCSIHLRERWHIASPHEITSLHYFTHLVVFGTELSKSFFCKNKVDPLRLRHLPLSKGEAG